MPSVIEELQALKQVSAEQALASQLLADEVAGKMGDITDLAAGAILPLGNNTVTYYVNPATGNDENTGTNTANSFASIDAALILATSSEMRGKYISIYLEGGHDYHLSVNYNIYNRYIYISSRTSSNRANFYFDGILSGTSFGMYHFGIYGAGLIYANLDMYWPLFADVVGHNNALNKTAAGVSNPGVYSNKFVAMLFCNAFLGDQYLLSPAVGDMTSIVFYGGSLGFRAERTTSEPPIQLNYSATLRLNIVNWTLNDGLLVKEDSLFNGVKFTNGVPINVVSNVAIAEVI